MEDSIGISEHVNVDALMDFIDNTKIKAKHHTGLELSDLGILGVSI